MRRLIGISELLINLFVFLILCPIAFIVYRKKNVWLFCERGNDAKDNAFFFFRWINTTHKDVQSYYVINKKSFDYSRVISTGKIVKKGSLKHWLVYISSKVRVFTHLYTCSPNKYLSVFFIKYKKRRSIDVFVQHGITYNFQDCFFKINNKADLVICGAKSEYDYLIKNFDLGPKVLKFTGFPRYDTLKNLKPPYKTILVQPTWRSWLANLDEQCFIESDYYKKWESLINNGVLIKYLELNNINMIFCVHPSFLDKSDLFSSGSKNVIIKKTDNIQELFNSSSVLITDYSSILFDYAFLKKPTIYYQFDKELFFSKQYKPGYFSIEDNGFGPVIETEEALIKEIVSVFESGCAFKDKYKNRVESFFGIINNCCEKVYREILNYEK